MSTIQVKWLDKLQFVGVDSTRHSVVMSAPDEDNGIGVKPSDMLLLALGGCTAYDVVNILTKKRQPIADLEVVVVGEQAPDPPWAFTHIRLTYRLRGQGLSEKAVRDAIDLSKTKYCSVSATLAAGVEIHTDFVIEE